MPAIGPSRLETAHEATDDRLLEKIPRRGNSIGAARLEIDDMANPRLLVILGAYANSAWCFARNRSHSVPNSQLSHTIECHVASLHLRI